MTLFYIGSKNYMTRVCIYNAGYISAHVLIGDFDVEWRKLMLPLSQKVPQRPPGSQSCE